MTDLLLAAITYTRCPYCHREIVPGWPHYCERIGGWL